MIEYQDGKVERKNDVMNTARVEFSDKAAKASPGMYRTPSTSVEPRAYYDSKLALTSNVVIGENSEMGEEKYVSEQAVDVVVPPGRLGLILQTANDGSPMVHTVLSASSLHGQIEIGDRLVSVDDLDVTVLRASEVSKLIAAKSSQPQRRMLFVRSNNTAY